MYPIDIKSLKGVTQDSRQVKDGYLFAALKGDLFDGSDFIDDALSRGATFILSDKNSNNPRKEFSHIVADFYQKQPSNIIAVTGTNGKSSVVHFIDQILRMSGKKSAYIGTLSGNMTTPDPVSLHEELAKMADDGITHVALEASSHGLGQYRMDGALVNVAAFTNFSQDHLDYHENMDDYLSAKMRLFSEILYKDGVAVLNADIPEYESLMQVCKDSNLKIISYGENAKEIKLESCIISDLGQNIVIKFRGVNYSARIPLIGRFQIMNILCALACIAGHDEKDFELFLPMVENLKSVPGRLQHVSSSDGKINAYIDYAHTPDALENVLKSLRPYTKGKIFCVFGCGGDRDKLKRGVMGGVADKYADVIIVTDDNPRSENPDDIRKDILSRINSENIHEIPDRKEAINFAVKQMNFDDILLVAGKGHEQGQIFDGHVVPFDDVCEVKTALLGCN